VQATIHTERLDLVLMTPDQLAALALGEPATDPAATLSGGVA